MSTAGDKRQGEAVGGRCRAAFFGLGFVTLATQAVLLRELFSVLYGSDLAFGFALASWTVLGAAGALTATRRGAVPARVVCWGNCLYAVLGLAVFLAVRAWGARDVIPFHAYLLIPLFLSPLCLLGGMLFPWYLAASGVVPARAYGWEVCGGLAAGIVCAAMFHQGALACPLLLGLVVVTGAEAVAAALGRAGPVALGLAAVAAVALPVTVPGHALECLALRLRVREGQVVGAVNTPVTSLVAVQTPAGLPAVYENGTPWPAVDPSTAHTALSAVLWSLSPECRRAVVLHAVRSGFEPALSTLFPGNALRLLEADPTAAEFAWRQLAGERAEVPAVLRFGAQALDPQGEGWDLVAVLSPSPGGLLLNRPLTREFARRVRAVLSPAGVFVVAVPVAPGFTHPGQEAWIDTVRRALHEGFPALCELRSELGWTLLVGSAVPVEPGQAAARLAQRFPDAELGVVREALGILRQQGTVSLDLLAGGLAMPAGRPVPPEPANRIETPRAYFRYLEFRGYLVDEAPGWWRTLFRERSGAWSAGVLAVLCAAGWASRRVRRVQGVFWAAWGATATLIFAIYLFQSLAGEAFWAVSLLSAASLLGILCGTRCPPRRRLDWTVVGAAFVPAGLFPLCPILERSAGVVALAALLLAVCVSGSALGYVFARHGGAQAAAAPGGVLFAADLLGAGGGLFLGGVLLPWWSGFGSSAMLAALAAAAMLVLDAMKPRF